MNTRYRKVRRNGVYYVHDNQDGNRASLRTRDPEEAQEIVNAKNKSLRAGALSLQLARVYFAASDPEAVTRTWQHVMDLALQRLQGTTKSRWERAMKSPPFNLIRQRPLLETRSKDFLDVLAQGTVSTNVFLRRLHNFAFGLDWLPRPILPPKQWPKTRFKDKRAITGEEHLKILAGERNPEWRTYYKLIWHLGAAQSDIAALCAEDVDLENHVISFHRRKTGALAQLHFGKEVKNIINDLPGEGPLFLRIGQMTESDRASLFRRRCRLVGVSGVSLHSYRYSWAERAKTAGYPERFAQEALGHNSKAVHRAYSRNALVKVPSLEEFEAKLRTE